MNNVEEYLIQSLTRQNIFLEERLRIMESMFQQTPSLASDAALHQNVKLSQEVLRLERELSVVKAENEVLKRSIK